jgi:type IV pilus assembly protein PilE
MEPVPSAAGVSSPGLTSSRWLRRLGFSLIESLIVLAILAMLAAMAYPSYLQQLRKARRSEAEAVLLEAQQYLQRRYMGHNSFEGAELSQVGLGVSPKSAPPGAQDYDIAVQVLDDGQDYELRATPVVTRPDPQCGDLVLSATGLKSTSGEGGLACWR